MDTGPNLENVVLEKRVDSHVEILKGNSNSNFEKLKDWNIEDENQYITKLKEDDN